MSVLNGQFNARLQRIERASSEGGGGGGSSLPSYTTADKGKFLGLGDGSSSTVEPKWGNAVLLVKFTLDEDSGDWVADKTYAEIAAANAQLVLFEGSDGQSIAVNAGGVYFSQIFSISPNIPNILSSETLYIMQDESVGHSKTLYALTPST